MMKRIILTAVFLLGAVALASAAPMAVPSVTSSETIVYQQPEIENPTYPVRPNPTVPDCSQYPGTVAFGMDCVPTNNPPVVCYEPQVMRNGVCVNRGGVTTQLPPPTSVLYPREVQTELKRVGCLGGGVDGIWGNGSRSSLRKFYERARLSAASTEPTQVVLSDVQSQRGRICPAVYVAPSGPNCSRIKYAYKSGNTCKCEGTRKFNGKYCIKTTTTASTGGGKPKCSKIKYAYTSGNTCKCSGGRSFNGKYCVKQPQTTTTQVHSDQASVGVVIGIIGAIGDASKNDNKCYKSCDDEGRNCETVCE